MPRPPKDAKSFSSLLQIVADLRGPEGCPWDKEQTHQSLAPYTIEESFELAEILDQVTQTADPKIDTKLKDELGDVLFQVALHAQLATERNAFRIEDVIENINEKLVRRHPHVFSDTQVENIEEVWANWEKIKANEKKSKGEGSKTFDIPQALPSLQRAYKIGIKTEKKKFDWPNLSGVRKKLEEELTELDQAINKNDLENIQEELGDVLFTLAQVSRHLNFDPEQALRKANAKFEKRFEAMLKLAQERKLSWDQISDSEKEKLWQEIK